MSQPWFQSPLFRAAVFVVIGIFLLIKSNGDPVVIVGGIFIALAGIGLNYYAWQLSQKQLKESDAPAPEERP